jgi:hypothetical protein
LRTVGQTIRDAAYRVGQFMKRNVNQSMRNWQEPYVFVCLF